MGFEDRPYYRDENPFYSGTYSSGRSIVWTLIIINVAIFFIDMFTPTVGDDGTHWLCKALAIKMDGLWQVWTFLTHGFAHSSFNTDLGIFHILGNMFTLFFLGRPVEERLGRFEFLRFYLIAIVISGIGWMLFQLAFGSNPEAFIIGASGAVSAVVVYFIFMAPKATLLLFGVLPLPAWGVGVMLLVMNLFHAFSPASHVAWESHLVGALFGLAYFRLGWNFEKLQLKGIKKSLRPRPNLRVHDPSAADEKLNSEADRILAKINEQGEESLSPKERRVLNRYSKRLRKNRDQ